MGDFLLAILNGILSGLSKVLNLVVLALPKSPFTYLETSVVADYLPAINWFIPISSMIAIGEAWLTAIALFYIIQTILRWVKAIE